MLLRQSDQQFRPFTFYSSDTPRRSCNHHWMGEHKLGYFIQKNSICAYVWATCVLVWNRLVQKRQLEKAKNLPQELQVATNRQTTRDYQMLPWQESICVHGSVSQNATLTWMVAKDGKKQPLLTLTLTLHEMTFQELASLLHTLKIYSLCSLHTCLY